MADTLRRARKQERLNQDPAPEVNLLDFNPLGCTIAVRGYTHTDHYWQVYFGINEAIARVCGEAGWPTPYVVHGNKDV